MKKNFQNTEHEEGFASLIIAFILILVMSLVSVGFAQLARHEQQDALQKELSNQAYYAAESGINDIEAELPSLEADYQADMTNPELTGQSCLGPPYVQNSSGASGPSSSYGVLNQQSDVNYTCALVNFSQHSLLTPAGNPTPAGYNFVFNTNGGTPSQFTFSWGSADTPPNNAPASASDVFPDLSTWSGSGPGNGSPGVVQLSITPLGNEVGSATAAVTRDGMIANTFTAYLYPANGATGTISYSTDDYSGNCTGAYSSTNDCDDSSSNAPIVNALYNAANDPYPYSASVVNLPSGNNTWLVHVVFLYDPSVGCLDADPVNAGCNNGGSYGNAVPPNPITLDNSEVSIDVTGKAKDVEKRLYEVVNEASTSNPVQTIEEGTSTVPSFAVNSGNTCKEFATNPATPGASVSAQTDYTAQGTASLVAHPTADCMLGPP